MHRIAPLMFSLVLVLLLATPTAVAATTLAAQSAIAWEPCPLPAAPTQECAELAVPLDYDEPDGATITLAVARIPATDQDERIGSIMLNPGGPGGPGVFALPIQYASLPAALQERFDIVGFDPRGVGESAPVRCFDSVAEQIAFLYFADMPRVPVGPEEEAAWAVAAAELAQRCGERNAETLAHLSTANVARDMDELRRAVGDEALNYFGTSYGTYLGATYANLFPDRIRAMALDGVINPPSYTSFDFGDGDIVGPNTTSFLRILSNQGSADALQEFFDRCAAAGPDHCAFAAASAAETSAKFDALMDRLRAEPMAVLGPAGTLTVTYSIVDDTLWQALYAAPKWSALAQGLQRLEEGNAAGFLVAMGIVGGPPPAMYNNIFEGQYANNCLDTDNPADPALYPEMARQAEARTPHFGALWTYQGMPCAFWPAEDADRYTGPWDAETSAPILLISRLYDPATPHGGAVLAAETLANARLLTIDGWGHGYFVAGRSTCADDFTAAYFIDLTLPPEGTICAEDVAPFSELLVDEAGLATPVAPPGVKAQTTALLVSAIHNPLRVMGSDGMVHLEYDLVLTNLFTAPVTITAIDVLTPEGQSLLRLEDEALQAMTRPLFGSTPTDVVPQSGALVAMLDVIVAPGDVPERLTHRITYDLPPDAPALAVIGSREILGPELTVDPFAPLVIAPPLRGAGWMNANGCCDASAHRSAILAVDGDRLVKFETFAIDWIRLEGPRFYAGDGARNEDHFAFGAELLAVADGTVVFVRDGMPEETPFEPSKSLRQPLDYGGNEVVLEIAPGVFAFYAHLQPGSIRVEIGDVVQTGEVLGLLGNSGNTDAAHLHFQLADGPDVLTATSLPFVIDAWTLAGIVSPEGSRTDIRVVGPPEPQTATFPLEMTVADFP